MEKVLLVLLLVGLPLLLLNGSRIINYFAVYFRYLSIKEVQMNKLFSRFENDPSSVSDKDLSDMYDYFFEAPVASPCVDYECGSVDMETVGGFKASRILKEISNRRTV